MADTVSVRPKSVAEMISGSIAAQASVALVPAGVARRPRRPGKRSSRWMLPPQAAHLYQQSPHAPQKLSPRPQPLSAPQTSVPCARDLGGAVGENRYPLTNEPTAGLLCMPIETGAAGYYTEHVCALIEAQMLRGQHGGCSSEGSTPAQHHLQPVSARPPTAHALNCAACHCTGP